MEFCKELVENDDLTFSDVIWTDECSVQLESRRKVTYHRKGEPARMCSKPKQNTQADGRRITLNERESTGGRRLCQVLTSIQLKMCGSP